MKALKEIKAQDGNVIAWLKSETRNLEEIQAKGSYLSLHPELRQLLTEPEFRSIEPAFEKFSNLRIFEKIAGGDLLIDAKSESFQWISFDFPAGGKRVMLGSPTDERGRSRLEYQHEVILTQSFEMQVTPVTQLQWTLIMRKNPSSFRSSGNRFQIDGHEVKIQPNHPVEQVSWDDWG